MARYRFSWDNLPPGLLSRLGADLGLRAPVAAALRSRYGARPEPEFVRDAWPALVESWLSEDDGSRELAVRELRARRLGDALPAQPSAADELAYLRSCRNSASLRNVITSIFTARGEPKPIGTPFPTKTARGLRDGQAPDPAPSPPSDVAEGPDGQPESLDEWLGRAVAEILGAAEAPRDDDGDIPIRSGSAMCYLRSIDNPPSLRLFSPMVVEVARTPALLEALNEINMTISVGRVFHTPGNEVVFALELYGDQLTVDIIRASLAAATVVADYFDHQLQSRFGGKTLFPETTDDSVMV